MYEPKNTNDKPIPGVVWLAAHSGCFWVTKDQKGNQEIKGNNANTSPSYDNRGNDEKGYMSIQFTYTMQHPDVLNTMLGIVQGVEETEHMTFDLKKIEE